VPESLEAGPLVASLLISTVGFALFVYGKKQSRWPHMAGGALLMAFPYFVPTVWVMVSIAVAICALVGFAVRFGA